MAAVAPPADQAADLMQKLSLDSQNKTLEIPEATKKTSVDSNDAANIQIQPFDRSITPLLPDFMDPTLCYLPSGYPSTAYYYGGYDGNTNDWDSRYLNQDGVELTPGVYGDNGSLMYHHGYGYTPYGPYSSAGTAVHTVGHDGQVYGAQHYQYPTPYFQPLAPTNGTYSQNPPAPPKCEIPTSAAAEQAPLSVDNPNGNSNGIATGGVAKGNNGSTPMRPTYQSASVNSNGNYGRGVLPGGLASAGYHDPRFGYDGRLSPVSWLDGSIFSDGQPRPVTNTPVTSTSMTASITNGNKNQSLHPHSHFMGLHHPRPMPGITHANGYLNRMYPNKFYNQYGNNFRSGLGFGPHAYDSRANGRGWFTVDSKYKPRGRGNGYYGYGNENMDGLNELNRGPRAKNSKNQKTFIPTVVAVKGQNIPLTNSVDCEKDKLSATVDRKQYNQADFPENYVDAKFFIIKSYSEDDIHKSIKYNVWASTPNGNKKLDAAYQETKQKSGDCPVFLFFSVNTSGQFVGVAEMVGPVDFNKNLEYWQQDKWIGCFPVKWHFVKDVPNNLLKHITLENNENKPVTNSRDTQEVKLEQGLQLLKIFKDHASTLSILDDFAFYEERQKKIQEKKAKQQQFQRQVWEGKPVDVKSKEGSNGVFKSFKQSEVASDLVRETVAVHANGDINGFENGSVVKSADLLTSKPGTEKIIVNGEANGC